MGSFPQFGAFVLRAQEKTGRTCINGLPVASPAKQMLGRFPYLQSIRHDNLAVYLHFSETVIARDLVIVVMEHHSSTLAESLKAGEIKEDAVKSVLYSEICAAMEVLHRNNVIHGFLDIDSIVTIRKDNNDISTKLSGYGLPFLTNYGKDIASFMKFGFFLAPERILNEEESLFAATYQSDVWELGFVLLQIYLVSFIQLSEPNTLFFQGIVLEPDMSESEYLEILNKNFSFESDKDNSVMEDIIQLLTNKKRLPYHKKCEWLEEIITKCLRMDWESRPSINEVIEKINEQIPKLTKRSIYDVMTAEDMRAKVKTEMAKDRDGFEKLSLENAFYLWKTCGSSPEIILLKKGIIQNHAPISSYPIVRFDDFNQVDQGVESQSTFEYGVFELPKKKTLARIEKGQKVSARMFHKIGITKNYDHLKENILYETASNMLTIDHLLNASAVFGVSSIVSRLSKIGVISTQRSDGIGHTESIFIIVFLLVWCTLLDIDETKWSTYLNLDLLAPHSSDRQLEVDIPRCHQYDSFMTTPAVQESLRKVLKGWQIITESDNYVYWQGCDSLATPFLLANMSKPYVAYACFKEFTHRYCYKFYLKDNSEVIKEYLGIFYHLVAYIDPVLYKHLKNNGFDAELFAIPWFLTCFAHELPLSKLVRLWDETMIHGNSFPLMIALAMLNRLRDKLLSVNFNEMIIIIHDQPDLSIEEIIKNAKGYETIIPPSCTFRAHASPWKDSSRKLRRRRASFTELDERFIVGRAFTATLSTIVNRRITLADRTELDLSNRHSYQSEHFSNSFNHPSNGLVADIDWLRFLPGIVNSELPKCFIYGKNDKEATEALAGAYVMKGVPYVCVLHESYESIKDKSTLIVKT
ncbi:Protein CBG20603 [Caenorhabditis briggsae]|uniref:Protein CBG20603 n=1 Tax=Caenorhabditis briggsae TaxID=6238 RepID=A8XY66_CAEBR|nr:Protein CBG20603 [Caenorhabditis briggsae]CAP37583.2 Protein CBG20603 [Caenorhabditis briggsae]